MLKERWRDFRWSLPEILFWISALIYLASINPADARHLNFCPLKLLKFDFCPGCGLGKSLSFFLQGNFSESLRTHPLGIPAFFILAWRIITLIAKSLDLSAVRKQLLL